MTDGCGVPVTASIVIAAPTALSFASGSTTSPSCTSGTSGQIIVAQPTTGIAPYTYALISPSPVLVTAQAGRIFNNLAVGNYTIRVTDACGTQVDNGATGITVAATTAPALMIAPCMIIVPAPIVAWGET